MQICPVDLKKKEDTKRRYTRSAERKFSQLQAPWLRLFGTGKAHDQGHGAKRSIGDCHQPVYIEEKIRRLWAAMATHTTTYSEFFSSGLRAMAGTSYRRPSSVCSTSNSSTSSPRNPSRYSMLRNLARRSRTPSLSSNLSHDDTTSTRRERRSSILGLPSRLLDRFANIPDVSEKTDDHPQRSSDRLVRRNTFGYENKRPVIDPFDASPTSTSFFVDRDAPIARRDSFMLVAEPAAQRHSYFHFPRRRKSPASIHSLPLMPQSRRSSFQYRPPSWDKYDPSWALQEEEDSTLSWSPYPEEVPDPAAHIDWRQFHIDLLHEEA